MNQNPTPTQGPQAQLPQQRTVQVAMPNVKPYATYAILAVTTFIYLLQVGCHTCSMRTWSPPWE